MKNKKHIVWYADLDKLDFSNTWIKKWWIKQVLMHGTLEDIKELNLEELEIVLPELYLPENIKNLWVDYFNWKKHGRDINSNAKRNY